MATVLASSGCFRVYTAEASPTSSASPPRPIPGLTSSSSGWQWCLCSRSWQRWRLFTKPFLSGFSPFFTRWHTSPSVGLVAGLSVIAGQRLWSRDGNLHVGTRTLPAVQSGDSIRAGSVYNRATNSLTLSLTHATHTHIQHTRTHTYTHTRITHTLWNLKIHTFNTGNQRP